ncbi:MAG: hypothetical protein Q8K36_06215, partial [Alphaproteobacteria bacterium]|nr:hypothetical protein [Alphaproteobacteria bacterium]
MGKKNTGASVTLWYDSAFVTPEQVKKTEDLLQEHPTNIQIRDVRSLDSVKRFEESKPTARSVIPL